MHRTIEITVPPSHTDELVGAALAVGEPGLAYGALGRFLISAALVVAAGVIVVGLKQAIVHRRKPMV